MRPFPIFSCCVISFQWLTLFVTRGGRNEKTNEEEIGGERLFMEWRDTQVIILAYLSVCLSVHIMYHFSISDEKIWVINLNAVLPETDDFPFHEHSWCGSVYLHKINHVNVMWMWKNWHWEKLQLAVYLIWIQAVQTLNLGMHRLQEELDRKPKINNK